MESSLKGSYGVTLLDPIGTAEPSSGEAERPRSCPRGSVLPEPVQHAPVEAAAIAMWAQIQ